MPDDIRSLAEEYFEYVSAAEPTEAHMRGDYRFADRFEDLSREAEDADVAARREFASRARAIDPATLAPQDALTREVLLYVTETSADVTEAHLAEFAVDPIFGLQALLPVLVPQLSVPTPAVAAAMTDKFRGFARAYDQLAERLREGVARGRVPAEFAVTKVVAQLDRLLALPLESEPLLRIQTPERFSDSDAATWKEQLATVVREEIRPAMRRYRDVVRDEVGPTARPDEHAGLTWLPDGDVAYARTVHKATTLSLDPAEIHEIGLREVERLAAEYRELGPAVLGTSDLEEIFHRFREDPALHHTTGDGVVAAAEAAFAKARAAMDAWFGRLPAADCVVRPTTSGAVAYYFPPAEDGTRPGTFFMNVADPTSWGTYEIEATAFHEGIPGHHLQIAIAQELGNAIPAFRRHNYIPAYAEGWGLYTERLADEMGLYSSPLDRMGMLAADSTRACRLVVDTGIHALGWSRERAIAYMAEHSPATLHAVEEEIDRYIGYPGQALSYMIGRLEIERIRRNAETRLGDRFDIRTFHDVLLGSADVPLETLERLVDTWVATG